MSRAYATYSPMDIAGDISENIGTILVSGAVCYWLEVRGVRAVVVGATPTANAFHARVLN